MLELTAELGIELPHHWWDERKDGASAIYSLYKAAKARIAAMECRIVAFEDDTRGTQSTIAEVYAHLCLGTPYNDFSTS